MNAKSNGQVDKFMNAARADECDEDEAYWEAKLKQVVKHEANDAPDKPE